MVGINTYRKFHTPTACSESNTDNSLMLFNSINCSDVVVWNITLLVWRHVPSIPPVTIPTIHKFKLEVLREHRPPPNASIIELWEFFPDPESDPDRHQNVISWSLGQLSISTPQLSIKFHQNPLVTFSIIQWTRISDFGLLDPDSDLDRHQNWTHWPPSKKFRQNPFTIFSLIQRTDTQTNRQTEVRT